MNALEASISQLRASLQASLDPKHVTIQQRNLRLLNAIESLIRTCHACLARLEARKKDLNANTAVNECLLSLQQDFVSAAAWVARNEVSLRSKVNAKDAALQIEDLDKKLTISFARKISLAILEAVQDVTEETRASTAAINAKLNDLGEDLLAAVAATVRDTSAGSIVKALQILREEERASKPDANGFHDNEVEKVIASLIDALSARQADQQDEPSPSHQSPEPVESDISALNLHSIGRSSTHEPTLPSRDNFTASLPARSLSDYGTIGSLRHNTSLYSSISNLHQHDETRSQPSTASTSHEAVSEPTEDLIGFKPVDATTKRPIIDPVLCSDNLIHCRWEIIYPSGDPPLTAASTSTNTSSTSSTPETTIIGELEQLRDALFALYPDRKQEFHLRRQSFKDQCLALCGEAGHLQLQSLIWHLTQVLSWEPKSTSVHWLVRRGVAYYRLRCFKEAQSDLDKAVDISISKRKGRKDVDALRYRALVREMCHDVEGALDDVDEILKHQGKQDPVAYALRASIKASQGLLDAALSDIDRIGNAISSAAKWQSEVAMENFDLVYLTSGWARASVGNLEESIEDFNMSLHQRRSVEPYALASRGLAQIGLGHIEAGFSSLEEAFVETESDLLHLMKHEERRPVTFDLYQLRGMAHFYTGDHARALEDMERAVQLRPAEVKDTGEFRFSMACIKASLGYMNDALIDLDFACALKPGQRDQYRSQLGQN